MKRFGKCLSLFAAAALALSLCACSARNSSDNKLILDGHKFQIGQSTIEALTQSGLTMEVDADPEMSVPAGTLIDHAITFTKAGVPAASAVAANPTKMPLPLSQCRIYKLTGYYQADGKEGACQVILGGTDFKGYNREQVEKAMGTPDNLEKNGDISTLNPFSYDGSNYEVLFSFDENGIVTQVELDRTGYTSGQ